MESVRRKMVELNRQGWSLRRIAMHLGVSKDTVKKWIERANDKRLDRVDFSDHRSQKKTTHNRISSAVEQCIIDTRQYLKKYSPLGEFGAEAIHRAMEADGCFCLPSVRTINNVLKRNGLLDSNSRIRFPAPPPGWYIPEVCTQQAEMDCFDYIEDLRLTGNLGFAFVLNAVSLHGSLANSWTCPRMSAEFTASRVLEHWKQYGRPAYVQFDNGPVFNGPPKPNQLGRVSRMCLELGTTVVFTIPRNTGPQAKIERFNLQWQNSVWNRFTFSDWDALNFQNEAFLAAYRQKNAAKIANAPQRFPVPKDWQTSYPTDVQGKIIYLRQTDQNGNVTILGQNYPVDPNWTLRLVRCDVDLTNNQINIYRLRRRAYNDQPLLQTIEYKFPRRKFTPNSNN